MRRHRRRSARRGRTEIARHKAAHPAAVAVLTAAVVHGPDVVLFVVGVVHVVHFAVAHQQQLQQLANRVENTGKAAVRRQRLDGRFHAAAAARKRHTEEIHSVTVVQKRFPIGNVDVGQLTCAREQKPLQQFVITKIRDIYLILYTARIVVLYTTNINFKYYIIYHLIYYTMCEFFFLNIILLFILNIYYIYLYVCIKQKKLFYSLRIIHNFKSL